MRPTVFTNVSIFDGTGAAPFPGEIRVEDNRITQLGRGAERVGHEGADIVEGNGMTLMPGMTEAHSHLCFTSAIDRITTEDMPPPEQHLFHMAHNAKTLLDHGFTSAYSGGAVRPLLEIALRDEIAAGWVPGPRLKASSFERNAKGERHEWALNLQDAKNFVQEMIDIGVDSIKLVIDGHGARNEPHWYDLNYDDETVATMVKLAHDAGVSTTSHTFTEEGTKRAVRGGVRVLYHVNFTDEEGLDLIEKRKSDIIVAPTIGVHHASIEAGLRRFKTRKEAEQKVGSFRLAEGHAKTVPELRKRGIRMCIGGDYGFPFNPQGRNARDLELLVKHHGFTPAEALTAATLNGGVLMGMGDELGQIKPGYLADFLVVDGDPLADIAIMQDKDRLAMIVKDGVFHKRARANADGLKIAAE